MRNVLWFLPFLSGCGDANPFNHKTDSGLNNLVTEGGASPGSEVKIPTPTHLLSIFREPIHCPVRMPDGSILDTWGYPGSVDPVFRKEMTLAYEKNLTLFPPYYEKKFNDFEASPDGFAVPVERVGYFSWKGEPVPREVQFEFTGVKTATGIELSNRLVSERGVFDANMTLTALDDGSYSGTVVSSFVDAVTAAANCSYSHKVTLTPL
jgi:hypothetical protein